MGELSQTNPQDQIFKSNVENFVERNKLYYTTKKTEKEISRTKDEIDNLKSNIKTDIITNLKTIPVDMPQPPSAEVATKEGAPLLQIFKVEKEDKEPVSQAMPNSVEVNKNDQVAQLEAKLAKQMEALAQLEVMRKKYEEQRQKSDVLTKELADNKLREKLLMTKLEDSSKVPPIIVIASPKDHSNVEFGFVHLSGVVEDEKGVQKLDIMINEKPLARGDARGLAVTGMNAPKRHEFKERISLEKGMNQITIRAVDSDGLISEKSLTVQYTEKRKNIWAVVIGIDKYPKVRQLKYAVNDSRLFYDYLVERNLIPADNVTLLLDQDATLEKIKSVLGTTLKNKAGKGDMVIIYFAGHGATEKDNFSPDGDGLEKYLLPYNADLNDLYSTALPMGELSRIFNRISSERLIYIADSCYSGASGGRTIGLTGMRANISDAFMDRVASGKGRVIITASGANEVSAENDDLKHGVFTYYLIEGLKGKADTDKDGIITVDEAYNYVTVNVPLATGQAQHPVKKGSVEGQLVMGIVK